MADGKAEGARRAAKRSQAREYARTVMDYAEMCQLRVEGDSFHDAEISADYLLAHTESLREVIRELKQ